MKILVFKQKLADREEIFTSLTVTVYYPRCSVCLVNHSKSTSVTNIILILKFKFVQLTLFLIELIRHQTTPFLDYMTSIPP